MVPIPRKKDFIFIIIIILLISGPSYFFAIAPYRVAEAHEAAYFEKLTSFQNHHSPYNASNETMTSQHMRPIPLIHNAFQLSSFWWESQLELYLTKTAKYPLQSRWVYVGGTPQMPRSWREKISLFSPPGKGSCVDSPSVCSDFNAAFNTLADNSLGPNPQDWIRTSLAFFDCDNSPLLCDIFRIDPVMLLYLETKPPCFVKKNYSFECSTRWTYISLPLKKMAFHRKVWINGFLVPAFPSAVEQLRSIMLWDGSLNGLDLEEDAFDDKVVESRDGDFTFEGVVKGAGDGLYEQKLREVVSFLSFVLQRRRPGD